MRRLIALAAAAVLTAGIGVAASWPAQAQTGNQICNGKCLNAWNGGPEINQESLGAVNNDFTVISSPTAGDVELLSTSGDGEAGSCAGDYGNSQYDARAGLDPDCQSDVVPWGGNLQEQACGPVGVDFWDVHWQAYIAFSGSGNGDPVYLNGSKTCYVLDPAAG
jgi:hypothetical protein